MDGGPAFDAVRELDNNGENNGEGDGNLIEQLMDNAMDELGQQLWEEDEVKIYKKWKYRW